jgi:outer membrane protein OmpA-like peptidoglycan-associated protein/opacity protein-like surface antigen
LLLFFKKEVFFFENFCSLAPKTTFRHHRRQSSETAMKRVVVGVVLLPCLAYAQPVTGPYVSLGGGVNLPTTQSVAPTPGLFPRPIDYHFDPGPAGQGSVGYGFGNGLRVEVEGDFLTEHVKDVTGPTYPTRAGGYEQTYGGMANVLYDFGGNLGINPYIGAGFGGQVQALHNVNYQSIYARPLSPALAGRSQSVSGYAYQGIAGVAVPLPYVPGLSFTAEYRFLGLIDPLPAYRRAVERRVLDVLPPPLIGEGYVTKTFDINRRFGNNLNNSILIGLRYVFGAPPAPPPPAPTQAVAAAPEVPAARTYLVFFDWDRADLTARARAIIAEAASASTHVQVTKIDVNGYTDLSGTAAYNDRLSVRRARSVEAELVRDGVPPPAISIHGYGESNPLVPTAPGVREPQNRRVEIILHPGVI